MRRIGAVLFFLWAIGMVVMLAAAFWVQFQGDIQKDELKQHVEPRLLLGSGESAVTLTRLAQPNLICPPVKRAVDIALVIDRSGSMADNQAMQAALDAASQFVQTVDLATSRIAIFFFNNIVEQRQPFTQDKEALLQVLTDSIFPNAGTDIAQALKEVGTVLNMDTTSSTTSKVVILLTDGVSDERSAQQAAEKLKEQGIRIVTILLFSSEANTPLLTSIASTPSDFYSAPSPTELQTIYTNLAEMFNSVVAFDVKFTEGVNEALTVQPSTLVPIGVIQNNIISWEIPTLSSNAFSVSYKVLANQVGLYFLNTTPSHVSYRDCLAGVVETILPASSRILVMPPLWFLLLFGLLPLFPIAFTSWWKRSKPSPPSSPSPNRPSKSPNIEEHVPPPDPYPAWLKRLDEPRKMLSFEQVTASQTNYQPTIIIGLGSVGREVLSQIAQTLRSRHGQQLPSAIRLLQIDIQLQGLPETLPPPDYLQPDEWLLLKADLTQVSKTIQKSPDLWEHLNWYEPTVAEDYARSRGRMALFLDLRNGVGASSLWRALTQTTQNISSPKLKLVGSTFDDTSSGTVADLAYLIRAVFEGNIEVELWLSAPLNEDWSPRLNNSKRLVRIQEQKSRTLATLRELERLQTNRPIHFHYVAPHHSDENRLRQTTNYAIIQTLFLFAPLSPKTSTSDHLTTISDSLLATLHLPVQQTLSQILSRTEARANMLLNQRGMGMVCSLGAYSICMPLGLIEEALTWRILYELLYEEQIGIYTIIKRQPHGQYHEINPEDVAGNRADNQSSVEQLMDRFTNRLTTHDFFSAVAHKISDLLNGETATGPSPQHRANGLFKAINWLELLRRYLRAEGEIDPINQLNKPLHQLQSWATFLKEEVKPFIEQNRQAALQKLLNLSKQTGRKWAIDPSLDWEIYHTQVRSWEEFPNQLNNDDPLLKATRRFGWSVQYHPISQQINVQLWTPPTQFLWTTPEEVGDTATFQLSQKDKNHFCSSLYQQFFPLARNKTSSKYALDSAEKQDRKGWFEQSTPGLKINDIDASRQMGVSGGFRTNAIFIAPGGDRSQKLFTLIKTTSTAQLSQSFLCETTDQSTVTLLQVRDRVPLATATLYDEDQWSNNLVPASLYVWRAEQLAATYEESHQKLSTIMVSFLEQDPDLIYNFALAYLLGLLEQLSEQYLELPGLGEWQAQTPREGLENLFSSEKCPETFLRPRTRQDAIQKLKDACQKKQQTLWHNPGKNRYLHQAEKEMVQPLLNSLDSRDKQLAIYLQGVIRQLLQS